MPVAPLPPATASSEAQLCCRRRERAVPRCTARPAEGELAPRFGTDAEPKSEFSEALFWWSCRNFACLFHLVLVLNELRRGLTSFVMRAQNLLEVQPLLFRFRKDLSRKFARGWCHAASPDKFRRCGVRLIISILVWGQTSLSRSFRYLPTPFPNTGRGKTTLKSKARKYPF